MSARRRTTIEHSQEHFDDDVIATLREALVDHMSAEQLKKLCRLTPEKAPTRKAEMAEQLLRYLEGDRLSSIYESMDELQRAAVAEVVHSRGTSFPESLFLAKYGKLPDFGAADYYEKRNASPLRFFFYGYDKIMPLDLKKRLLAFVPPPRASAVACLNELPDTFDRPYSRYNSKTRETETGTEPISLTVYATEITAQRELLSVLRLIDSGKISVGEKTLKPSKGAVKAVTGILEPDDFYQYEPPSRKYYDENAGPIRAFAWPVIVQAGKLATRSGTRLILTNMGRKALTAEPPDILRALWEKWLRTTILDELSRIECVKGRTGKGKRGLTAVAGRRQAVASALSQCPVNRWMAVDEFFRFLRASGNSAGVTRNAWDLYIVDSNYGSLGYSGGEEALEMGYLLCFLLEYAATLGLIDVALIPPAHAYRYYENLWGTDDLPYFTRCDGLMYFRLNSMGAYCLGTSPTYVRPGLTSNAVLRVLANFEIAAVDQTLPQSHRIALDMYFEQVSDLVWRIDREKLLSLVDKGRTIEEVSLFLETHSQGQLPETVSWMLKDMAERADRLMDRGMARIVECADPSLVLLIANDTKTRKHCMRAGERHLVVPLRSEQAFRRNLQKLGYTISADKPAGKTKGDDVG